MRTVAATPVFQSNLIFARWAVFTSAVTAGLLSTSSVAASVIDQTASDTVSGRRRIAGIEEMTVPQAFTFR